MSSASQEKDDITLGDGYRWCTVVHPSQPRAGRQPGRARPAARARDGRGDPALPGRGRHARPRAERRRLPADLRGAAAPRGSSSSSRPRQRPYGTEAAVPRQLGQLAGARGAAATATRGGLRLTLSRLRPTQRHRRRGSRPSSRAVELLGVLSVDAVRAALDDDSSLPATCSWVRWPETSSGTIASESPWMTSVGTVILARSPRKSVTHERMHSTAACTSAWAARPSACCRCSSVTFSSPSAQKKFVRKPSRKPGGSASSSLLHAARPSRRPGRRRGGRRP